MRLFAWRGRKILMSAILFATLFGAAISAQAQEMEMPGIAIYVVGGIPNNEKKVLSQYLLNAFINAGQGKNADGAEAFVAAATADEQAKGGAALSKARVCELGKQFNIRFICVASVTQAFEFFVISASIVDTELEEILLKSEASSHLKTIQDLTQVSNQIVESMFGIKIPDTQTARQQMPAQSAGTGSTAADASDAASTPAVTVTGDAKVVVDKVVAAVKAFKDATTKSIDAANAVKTAAQSKNFSAIMDAKKKVQAAAEALKQAKTDVTAAIDALNSAGPEATAAVKAMGIDLSMFARKGGDSETDTQKLARNTFLVDVAPMLIGIGQSIGSDKMSAFGFGVQYEVMLSNYCGLALRYNYYGEWHSGGGGVDVGHVKVDDTHSIHSFELHSRVYPTGKTFFIDAVGGYYTNTVSGNEKYTEYYYGPGGFDYDDYKYYSYTYYRPYTNTYQSGKIGAMLGWRMGFGKASGFIWELAFGFRAALEYEDSGWPNLMFGGTGPRVVSALGLRF